MAKYTLSYDTPILKTCPICGQEKPYYNKIQRHCRDCTRERALKSRKESYLRHRELLKEEKKIKEEKKKQPNADIDAVMEYAKKHNIFSYGKAVIMMEKERKQKC